MNKETLYFKSTIFKGQEKRVNESIMFWSRCCKKNTWEIVQFVKLKSLGNEVFFSWIFVLPRICLQVYHCSSDSSTGKSF